MQKLMPERISHMDEALMSKDDIQRLKDKRNRQLLFLLPPYLALLGITAFQWSLGAPGVPGSRHFDEKDEQNFRTVAPYVFSFFLLMATIYFAKLFIQSLRPLMKDISNGKKSLIYYTPAKSAMPFFNKYYLSTPLYKNQQVEISREDFESIPGNQEICLEVGPVSVFILRLRNGERDINYY
jgi:hypothetical protein